jgi:aldehyde:ferredoxin oxidoreductase
MTGGFMNRSVSVDLARRTVVAEEIDEQIKRDFVGGYGTGVRQAYERQRAGVEPLGPENTLGFAAGPLTGTRAISSPRFTVMGKSPLTGGWGDANSGGYFGPKMKFAGVDSVFITGVSDDPTYLFIHDGTAELREASHLWGLDCYAAEAALKEELGKDVAAATIGPSGEKTCLIASVMTDKGRAAGRSGLGAVMGSKKLKAVVVKGDHKVPVHDEALLKEARDRYLGTLGVDRPSYEVYRTWGTSGVTADAVMTGDCPVKNWGGSALDFANADAISDDSVLKYQTKKYTCWGCPVACGGTVTVPDGPYAGVGAKPQYETLGAFGALCLNDNLESICRLNDICNRNGIDTISAGGTIAFAIECYENQLIGRADTDGLELTWGNHDAIVGMTDKLCKREGFGDVLADGVVAAAARIGRGSEEFAVHVGGQELAMHDPKVFPGLAVTYQVDPTPGRHTQSTEDWTPSFVGVTAHDVLDYRGRGADHLKAVAYQQIVNCSGLCQLATEAYDAEGILAFMTAVTGWEYTVDRLLLDGERILTLRHLFNLREGLNPVDLTVPSRMVGLPPQEEGPLAGVTVGHKEMVGEFYECVGWNVRSSMPSDATLERLGLRELVRRFGIA